MTSISLTSISSIVTSISLTSISSIVTSISLASISSIVTSISLSSISSIVTSKVSLSYEISLLELEHPLPVTLGYFVKKRMETI